MPLQCRSSAVVRQHAHSTQGWLTLKCNRSVCVSDFALVQDASTWPPPFQFKQPNDLGMCLTIVLFERGLPRPRFCAYVCPTKYVNVYIYNIIRVEPDGEGEIYGATTACRQQAMRPRCTEINSKRLVALSGPCGSHTLLSSTWRGGPAHLQQQWSGRFPSSPEHFVCRAEIGAELHISLCTCHLCRGTVLNKDV